MLCGTRAISARSMGICDGVPSTARSSFAFVSQSTWRKDSVDPDQTAPSGSTCLHMPFLFSKKSVYEIFRAQLFKALFA